MTKQILIVSAEKETATLVETSTATDQIQEEITFTLTGRWAVTVEQICEPYPNIEVVYQ